MKLYTEEELTKYLLDEGIMELSDLANNLIPHIELPSDGEIDVHVEDDFLNATEVHKYSEEAQLLMKAMCKAGALWMRDKIQGGSNLPLGSTLEGGSNLPLGSTLEGGSK
tara:strand:+ start:22 stop:351 length:330 start_codon:yes stop_codon:yes gene_type:complete